MDRIEIHGLRVMTVVGVLDHEREAAQPLQLDLVLHVDLADASESDDLADTANYGSVSQAVASAVRESKDLLLERVAGRVCEILLDFDRVEAVDVTVIKLRPPIPEDVQSSSVTLHRVRPRQGAPTRQTHRAIVALGSNLGDREDYLRFAVGELSPLVAESQVFETDPIGGPGGQGPYLNMVVAFDTTLDPFALVRRLQRIEAEAGRQRIVHWGARTLDLDLLFYDDATIKSPELTVPHPRYAERRFVLAPLMEVEPERAPADWDATLPPDGVHPRGPLSGL
jgi:dihydroneopterin aldolase / 2-amino-4-hydroxy-6-hydroxymethyldihydropteridine diphosphokinase